MMFFFNIQNLSPHKQKNYITLKLKNVLNQIWVYGATLRSSMTVRNCVFLHRLRLRFTHRIDTSPSLLTNGYYVNPKKPGRHTRLQIMLSLANLKFRLDIHILKYL